VNWFDAIGGSNGGGGFADDGSRGREDNLWMVLILPVPAAGFLSPSSTRATSGVGGDGGEEFGRNGEKSDVEQSHPGLN